MKLTKPASGLALTALNTTRSPTISSDTSQRSMTIWLSRRSGLAPVSRVGRSAAAASAAGVGAGLGVLLGAAVAGVPTSSRSRVLASAGDVGDHARLAPPPSVRAAGTAPVPGPPPAGPA